MHMSRFFRRSQGEPDVEFPKRGSEVSHIEGRAGVAVDQADQLDRSLQYFADEGAHLEGLLYRIKIQDLRQVVTPAVIQELEAIIAEYNTLHRAFVVLRGHYELYGREAQAVEVRLGEIEGEILRMQQAQAEITLEVAQASVDVLSSAHSKQDRSGIGTRDRRYDPERARMAASAGRRRDGLRALAEIASDPERGLPALLRERDTLRRQRGTLDRSRETLIEKASVVLTTDGEALRQRDQAVRGEIEDRIRRMEIGAASVTAAMNSQPAVRVAPGVRTETAPSLLDFRLEDL